jgi:hypothetical protein
MEFFYIVVSVLAVIILILALTFIGLMIQNGNKTQTFPPNTSQCPDLWIPDGSYCHYNGLNNGTYISSDRGVGNGVEKSNTGKFIMNSSGTVYDFSQTTSGFYPASSDGVSIKSFPMNTAPFFTYGGKNSTTINPFDPQWGTFGLSADCAKKKWAKLNNIEWSGITQLNTC